MDLPLRIALIAGAVFTLVLICSAIKKSKIMVEDSLFWMVFATVLVVLAIFPQIAYFCSRLIGIKSPSNFVFLCIIAILLIKEFRSSAKISLLKNRINQLAETVALDKNKEENESK
jgi:hypothetical protein